MVGIGPAVAGDVALSVVVVERPAWGHPSGTEHVKIVANGGDIVLCDPRSQQKIERKALVKLCWVGIGEEHFGHTRGVGLGDHEQLSTRVFALIGIDCFAPVPPGHMTLGSVHALWISAGHIGGAGAGGYRRCVWQTRGFPDRHDRVATETVDAAIEPEAQHVIEVIDDILVRPVEINLLLGKGVQIPLSGHAVGLGDARPRATAEYGVPVVWGQITVGSLPVTEEESGSFG